MVTQKEDLGIVGVVVEDWDIAKAFKPKTITTDYSSWIAYISRKAVPKNTPITDTEYWKPLTRLQSKLAFDYNKFKEEVTKELLNMRLLINTFIGSEHAPGTALANEFGNNVNVGVNQKILTDSVNKIWEKLEDITGEVLQGINMIVTPTYFISEDGCDIHVSANTVETNGIFEKIQFFVDGENIYEAENTEYVEPFVYHIDVKDDYNYVVMCKAKILGIEYTRQQVITRYNEFYIGAGTTYDDIMKPAYAKQLNGRMRHAYDVTFEDDDKLIIVMGASMRERFIRADLNGAEIALTEETVIIDNKDYVVFTSEPWSAGDYNIDING